MSGTIYPSFDSNLSTTDQVEYVSKRRSGGSLDEVVNDALFPMYAVSVQNFLTFDRLPMHEELLKSGLLEVIEENDVLVHFVSQRWLSWEHPDPDGVKLRLFQNICRKILDDDPRTLFDPYDWDTFATGTSSSATFQALRNELTGDTLPLDVDSFKESVHDGYVWWDYISVPQLSKESQKLAISSIPHYIERSAYFWVVVPEVRHSDTKEMVGYEEWQSRGWCRLEEWGNFLSKRVAPPLILTEAPRLGVVDAMDFLSLRSGIGGLARHAAGDGHFSCCEHKHSWKAPNGETVRISCDKLQIEEVLKKMLPNKLRHYKNTGKDFMAYFLRSCAYSVYAGTMLACPPDDVDDLLQEFRAENVDSNYEGLTPLTWACTFGDLGLVQELLDRGARADQSVTILQCAAQRGNLEILQVLLDSGHLDEAALRKGSPKANITGLDRGAKAGHAEITRCLLAARASPHVVRKDNGQTPLHTAAEGGYPQVCQALLEAGAQSDVKDSRGRTPLALAAQKLTLFGRSGGKVACGRLLLSAGADANLRDEWGRSARDIALEDRHERFVAVIDEFDVPQKIHLVEEVHVAIHRTRTSPVAFESHFAVPACCRMSLGPCRMRL